MYANDDIATLQARADKGDAEAQFELGMRYYHGDGVAQDKKKMFELFNQSAEKGNARAEFTLGEAYRKGVGVERNLKKGTELIRKSAEDGSVNGQIAMSVFYRDGVGVTKNEKESLVWKKKAEEQYARGVAKRKDTGEKEVKDAFKDNPDEKLETLDFRCGLKTGSDTPQMLLVKVSRDRAVVSEQAIDPHMKDGGSKPDEPAITEAAKFSSSAAGYRIDYGTDDSKKSITILHGAISYLRTPREGDEQKTLCVPLSAIKVKQFEDAEGMRQGKSPAADKDDKKKDTDKKDAPISKEQQ